MPNDTSPIQVVITKSSFMEDGFNVILMNAYQVISRETFSSREFALSAVADYMSELQLPPKP